MILTRDKGKRMWGGGGNSIVGGGGGGGSVDLSAYATSAEVEEGYLSKAFFNQLFTIRIKTRVLVEDTSTTPATVLSDTTTETVLPPNSIIPAQTVETDGAQRTTTTVTLDGIQLLAGGWTNSYLSALGQNSSGSGGGGGATYLTDLLDVNSSMSPSAGHVLTFRNGKWTSEAPQGGGGGTVTSVAMTVPTGFSVTGGPVTSSGTLALSFASGYALPTTSRMANWDAAFSWGNHALAGYATASSLNGYLPLSGGAMSNTYLVTNMNADLIDGHHVVTPGDAYTAGYYANRIPYIGTDMVMEVGRYIDFHATDNDNVDYATRLQLNVTSGGNVYENTVTLPFGSGQLALLTDNVASATYATNAGYANSAGRLHGNSAYSIWGRTYWSNGLPQNVTGDLLLNGGSGAGLYLSNSSHLIGWQNNGSHVASLISFGPNSNTGTYMSTVHGGLIIGSAMLSWDSASNALKVSATDGSGSINLYATGGVSALGIGGGGSGTDTDLPKSYTMPYIGSEGTQNYWHKLGTYRMDTAAMVMVIDIFTGDGYGGYASQNSWARIMLKKSSNTAGTASAVGVTCEQFGSVIANGKILVRVNAFSYNTGDIYIKCPWCYPIGAYTVQGNYTSWSHNATTTGDTTNPTGNQSVGYYDNTSTMITSE